MVRQLKALTALLQKLQGGSSCPVQVMEKAINSEQNHMDSSTTANEFSSVSHPQSKTVRMYTYVKSHMINKYIILRFG